VKARFLSSALLALGLALTGCPRAGRDDSGVAQLGPTAQTTASGLRYEDLVPGTGASAQNGQTVVVHYRGRLTSGTVFDESRPRGQPFKFKLGAAQVIKGWDEGVATMKVGGVRRLVVPPDLGYGDRPQAKIPANSTLVFDVELLGLE
jgi:peptidylprolyl isomerase